MFKKNKIYIKYGCSIIGAIILAAIFQYINLNIYQYFYYKKTGNIAQLFMTQNLFGYQKIIYLLCLSIIIWVIWFFLNKNKFNIKNWIKEVFQNKENKWENFFIKTSFLFGVIFMFAMPIMQVQDEDTHTMRSINMSYANIYDYKNGFNIFSSVYQYLDYYTEGQGIYIFEANPDYRLNSKKVIAASGIALNENQQILFIDGDMPGRLRTHLYGNLSYLPQGIGIFLGRILYLPIYFTLIMGRFIKLIFCIVLEYWAIRLMPFKKNLMTFICLMPMVLLFAASLSPDGILVSSCLLFISYTLDLKYNKKLKRKDTIILFILVCFIFSTKMIYSIIAFFLFNLLNKTFIEKLKKVPIALKVILSISIITFSAIIAYKVILNNELLYNCLQNPLKIIQMYFRTYIQNFGIYLKTLIGNFGTGYFPMPDIFIFLYFIYIFLLGISANQENMFIERKIKYLSIWCFALLTILIFVASFTMSDKNFVLLQGVTQGIQGRYFLPFLILALLPIESKKIKNNLFLKCHIEKIFIQIGLIWSIVWILMRYWISEIVIRLNF